MPIEQDHLAQLRASFEAVRDRDGDDRVVAEAVKTLLRVSIAHHEQALAKLDDTVFNGGAFSTRR